MNLISDILKKHKVSKINVSEEEIDKYFKIADLNRDGKISLEEAEVFFKSRLFDLNQSFNEKS
jgi:Ca2+-binding EF-hand superfamily protein